MNGAGVIAFVVGLALLCWAFQSNHGDADITAAKQQCFDMGGEVILNYHINSGYYLAGCKLTGK